jgi:hypothetical protein
MNLEIYTINKVDHQCIKKYLSKTNFFKTKGLSTRFNQRNDPFSILIEFPFDNSIGTLSTACSSTSSLAKNFSIRLLDTCA